MPKEKLSIIKIGGNIIEDETSLNAFLKLFSQIEGKKILVHGGGKRATHVATKLGIESKMVDGRRITDLKTLEVITMVYGGLVNKNIVAKLQALQTNLDVVHGWGRQNELNRTVRLLMTMLLWE